MTDRAPIEVEVVEYILCPQCQMVGGRTHQPFCKRTGDHTATLAPGSLGESLHRLGLATEELTSAALGLAEIPIVTDEALAAAMSRLAAAEEHAALALADVLQHRERQAGAAKRGEAAVSE